MSKEKTKKNLVCCFEWYDKTTKQTKPCGKIAVILYRGNQLCAECSNQIDKSNTAIEVIK
jgi:hypothetical protein